MKHGRIAGVRDRMSTLVGFLTDDHRACDERLAAVEEFARRGQWDAAAPAWQGFADGMRCHFAREEELLFPAFERATGSTQGPTAVMRIEHDQLRSLFVQAGDAITARDGKRFLALSDTLMVLMQQHNMKEEQILYPMSEQVIADVGALLDAIVAMGPTSG